jgi:hypothetical protein
VVGLVAAATMLFVGSAGASAASSGTPCGPAARACVNLSSQQAWLMQDGNVTYGPVPIASGKAGATSDRGTFRVFWKDLHHRSSLFNNAPMPYSVFYNGGEAFHQDSVSIRSNGCIHLSHSAPKLSTTPCASVTWCRSSADLRAVVTRSQNPHTSGEDGTVCPPQNALLVACDHGPRISTSTSGAG